MVDFFLVGAARSGTTSLYNYLICNPRIFLPNVKEPNFFANVNSSIPEEHELPDPKKKYHAKIITSLEVYESLYLSASPLQLKGDTSPSYMWDQTCAKRIFEYNPKAKIIISLRHPVDRAFSHFKMNLFIGHEREKDFLKALKSKKSPYWGGSNRYLEISQYFLQVKEYYDVFPEDQIKVIIFEEWVNNVGSCISEICSFLGIDPVQRSLLKVKEFNEVKETRLNFILRLLRIYRVKSLIKAVMSQEKIDFYKSKIFTSNRSGKKLDPGIRNNLNLLFVDEIEKLGSLVGIDFCDKWKI